MIPVLYPSTARDKDDPCIGHLADTISCKITEDIRGVFDIELQYPTNGPFASDILVDNIIVANYARRAFTNANEWGAISISAEFFDICKVEIVDDVMYVYGHQVSYRLKHSIVNGTGTASTKTLDQAWATIRGNATPLFNDITDPYLGFAPYVSTAASTISKWWESIATKSVRSFLIDDWYSLQKVYGIAVVFRRWDIIIATRRGIDNGVEVRVGKNLVKRQWSKDADGTFNALAPYWVRDNVKVVANPLIVTPTTARTPTLVVEMDFTDQFQTQPSAADLKTAARAFLDENKPWTPYETTHIEIAPRWDTGGGSYADRLVLGDDVTVFWKRTNVVKTVMQVVRTVYDVLSGEYETFELGDLQTGYVVTANV